MEQEEEARLFQFNMTEAFAAWLDGLRDRTARGLILARIRNMGLGNLGVVKHVGGGIWEAKLDYGPGYRLYYKQIGSTVYLLLIGGDKSTQAKDIRQAKELAKEYGI